MSQVIPDTTLRVWKVLEGFLLRYYRLLSNRSEVVKLAVGLQQENEELKQLVDQYLRAAVNQHLIVPPTHVIRVVSEPTPTLPPP